MNKTKVAAQRKPRRGRNGANGTQSNGPRRQRNGQTDRRVSEAARVSRRNLEVAIRRYTDLYEFAPVGYVTLYRSGRVEEANLAACELLATKARYLTGAPFSLCVIRDDLSLFLGHLTRCRSGESRVETNIHLKKRSGEIISVLLSSTATENLLHDGMQVFQTAIVDLTERERAEQAMRDKEAELNQIITQTPFMLTRCTRHLRYRYVSAA